MKHFPIFPDSCYYYYALYIYAIAVKSVQVFLFSYVKFFNWIFRFCLPIYKYICAEIAELIYFFSLCLIGKKNNIKKTHLKVNYFLEWITQHNNWGRVNFLFKFFWMFYNIYKMYMRKHEVCFSLGLFSPVKILNYRIHMRKFV